MELRATNATLFFEKQKANRLEKAACKLRRKKRSANFPNHIESQFVTLFRKTYENPFHDVFDEVMHGPIRRIRREIKWWEV